jgi:hypothetical protein
MRFPLRRYECSLIEVMFPRFTAYFPLGRLAIHRLLVFLVLGIFGRFGLFLLLVVLWLGVLSTERNGSQEE